MRLVKLALVLGMVVLLVGPALAQPPGGGFGRGMGGGALGGAMLLMNKGVQDELKMDKEQIEKIGDVTKKFREDNQEDFEKLRDRDLPQEERQAIMKKLTEAGTKAMNEVLKPDQAKRLKQIQRQQMGVALFNEEEVQKELKLNDDQKEKIKTIADESRKEMRDLFQGGGGFGAETMKKLQGIRKEAMASAIKVLTTEQQETLKAITGKPFELRMEGKPGTGRKPRKPRDG
jgi:Spy/CpxP family protein refolding chaperone